MLDTLMNSLRLYICSQLLVWITFWLPADHSAWYLVDDFARALARDD